MMSTETSARSLSRLLGLSELAITTVVRCSVTPMDSTDRAGPIHQSGRMGLAPIGHFAPTYFGHRTAPADKIALDLGHVRKCPE